MLVNILQIKSVHSALPKGLNNFKQQSSVRTKIIMHRVAGRVRDSSVAYNFLRANDKHPTFTENAHSLYKECLKTAENFSQFDCSLRKYRNTGCTINELREKLPDRKCLRSSKGSKNILQLHDFRETVLNNSLVFHFNYVFN